MPRLTTQGVRFTDAGLTVYLIVREKGGLVVRFAQVFVPWVHFDDSDAWAHYSRDAKRRCEEDDGADEPSLPLDWS